DGPRSSSAVELVEARPFVVTAIAWRPREVQCPEPVIRGDPKHAAVLRERSHLPEMGKQRGLDRAIRRQKGFVARERAGVFVAVGTLGLASHGFTRDTAPLRVTGLDAVADQPIVAHGGIGANTTVGFRIATLRAVAGIAVVGAHAFSTRHFGFGFGFGFGL